VKTFVNLKTEPTQYWLDLAEKYMRKGHTVTILARPSEQLAQQLGEQEKQRVEERKRTLGKKGLKELKNKVQNSIAENEALIAFFLYSIRVLSC
jgi:Zn-dependent M16 (insulinase) family peptidase